MAPLPDIADTYRCVFKWSADNVVNVTHFHDDTRTVSGLATAITAHVTAGMWAPIGNFLVINQFDLTPLFGDLATVSFNTDASAKWKGSVAGAESVPNCAAVVSMKTAFRGPRNRGRMYIGPVAESAMGYGTLDNTIRTTMINAWNAFGAACVADDFQHVVASYVGGTALTVLQYNVRPAVGTVRKRQDRKAA